MKHVVNIGIAALFFMTGLFSHAAEVVNLSARAKVGSDEETFIIGFVVNGVPGEKVAIYARGSGPTDNVSNPIGDPVVNLFLHEQGADNRVILANDNWMTGGQRLAISATGIPPTSESASAMIGVVEPGEYSFHLSDASSSGGIGIAEVFEMEFKDIPGSLVAADDFNTLLAAITAAASNTDIASILSGPGPFTLFAPTDAAFAKIPAETLEALLADPEMLADILLYHAFVGAGVAAADVSSGKLLMANGEEAIVQKTEAGGVIVQGASVQEADFMASNGIIHVIDTVMLPPSGMENIVDAVTAAGGFGTLLQAAVDTGAAATLVGEGPFTLFAPSDEAFAKLPEGTLESLTSEQLLDILLYHVVPAEVPASAVTNGKVTTANGQDAVVQVTPDGEVIIQGAKVTQTDIMGTNGIVHFIDNVMLPPAGDENIVDVLVAAGNFSTLIQAALDTGAADTLVTAGPFTLFAPTDAAFAALPEGTLESLTSEQLLDILLYHVVVGAQVAAADVTDGEVAMGNGANATLSTDGGVKINDANVILADLFGTNGVIHVIDKVILPPSM